MRTLLLLAALGLAAGEPPATRKDNFKEVLHGVEIIDPYRWLEDQDSPEVRQWIDAQNEYTRSLLLPLKTREPIARRLRELMRIDEVGSPMLRAGYLYFAKRKAADELWSVYRRKGLEGLDELLLDPHPFSADRSVSVLLLDVSRNGRVLAYSVRRGGEDEVEIRFMDPETKEEPGSRILRHLNRGFALKEDGSGCFYTVQDRERGPRIRRRQFARDTDSEIFGEGFGPDTFLAPALAGRDRYIIITAQHGWARCELYLKDLKTGAPPRPLITGVDAAFQVEPAGDQFVIHTNWKAPKWRVLTGDLASPEPERWREIVPEGQDTIDGIDVAGGKLFAHYVKNVVTEVKAFTLDGKPDGAVQLPGMGSAFIWGEWDDNQAFFGFTSFNHPWSIYSYDTATRKQQVFFEPALRFDSGGVKVRQVWYKSKDGTRVPMFLAHKRGLKMDGNLPVLLYGYGGFNASLTPHFSEEAAVWIEQGGVYAVANIRGGSEFGEEWHRAGMLDKKQNVFDDFTAAAEWLIENKYTHPRRLAIQGGSNGGLLVGAALTQRPDLFQAVLCEYPDLDMIGYYRFKNNNKPALLEYGDASKPEHFKFLIAYSPYQKVRDGVKYPAVLLTTGDADTRVPPLQARKMTARLQAATASGRPVLLLYDTKAGHAGGRTASKLIEDTSLELSFLFWQLGMKYRD